LKYKQTHYGRNRPLCTTLHNGTEGSCWEWHVTIAKYTAYGSYFLTPRH